MHNRVRMVVASFLVKDLHVDWTRGAAFFLEHLVDGDLASNQHGWQVGRGHRHRRSAVAPGVQPGGPGPALRPRRRPRPALGAELAGVASAAVHEPWNLPAGRARRVPRAAGGPRGRAGRALRRYDEVR